MKKIGSCFQQKEGQMISGQKEEIPPQIKPRNEDWTFRNDNERLAKQMGGSRSQIAL